MAFRPPNRDFGYRPPNMPFPARFSYERFNAPIRSPHQGLMMGNQIPRMEMPWFQDGPPPRRFPRPANQNFRGRFSESKNMQPINPQSENFKTEVSSHVISKVPGKDVMDQKDVKHAEEKRDTELIGRNDIPKKPTNISVKNEVDNDGIDELVDVILDSYDCDLHFNTDNMGLTGWTLHDKGFEYLWGGARASHGVAYGKVAFECTVIEALPVDVPETERNPHVLRVGWSVKDADLQLGEDKWSYGYGGTGKISVDSKFTDYGKPFSEGDVITCLADLDSKPKNIFYMLNGEYLGVAFQIGPDLQDKVLFPHVTIKNMKFSVNFGSQWPKYAITPGFTMLQNLSQKELVRGPVGPKSRQDAEFIMMVGLPACGKTVWAEKHSKENPEKRYYMLGTNNIIEKMRIFGLTRKRNYHGRWDALIKQATGCLNVWLKIAEKRIHNYILDQTNVYFTARRRKMGNFRGYKRIACVIVNNSEVLMERARKCETEEGKMVPEEAVMEMKANLSLPEVGETFDEVRYIEEKPPEAQTIVNAFKEEGMSYKRNHKRPGSQEEYAKPKTARTDNTYVASLQNNIAVSNDKIRDRSDGYARYEGSFGQRESRIETQYQGNQYAFHGQTDSKSSYQRSYQERSQQPHLGSHRSNDNIRHQNDDLFPARYSDKDLFPLKIKEEPIDNTTDDMYGRNDNQQGRMTSNYGNSYRNFTSHNASNDNRRSSYNYSYHDNSLRDERQQSIDRHDVDQKYPKYERSEYPSWNTNLQNRIPLSSQRDFCEQFHRTSPHTEYQSYSEQRKHYTSQERSSTSNPYSNNNAPLTYSHQSLSSQASSSMAAPSQSYIYQQQYDTQQQSRETLQQRYETHKY